MAYLTIQDFKSGVDRTRPIYALPSGSLWEGINCHVSRGGDVEKRKAFVQKHSLPVTTFGLAATASALYTFGSEAAPVVPAGITYQRLAHESGHAMSKLLDVDLFDGLIYAIAEYVNGDRRHFYDGTRVTDWDGGGDLPFSIGKYCKTHKRKMYSIIDSIAFFCALDEATMWDTVADPGAGYINLSNHASGSSMLTGLGVYQDKMAFLAREVIQIWTVENDDDNNAPFQIIEETGTRARGSVRQFGNLDLFYLADTGIRSLRARDNTNAAAVQDVGTPIDTLIQDYIADLSDEEIEDAVAVVEPKDGRFWLALGERVFVFSYFPSKKVSAWTWYEPGFQATHFAKLNGRVWCRAGNHVYLYGGDDNETYDSARVTVQLPFNSVRGKDGTFKQFEGMDIAAKGEWNCKWLVNPDPTNPANLSEYVDIGDLEGVTYQGPANPGSVHATHVAPILVNEAAGPASLSLVTLYHEQADNKE